MFHEFFLQDSCNSVHLNPSEIFAHFYDAVCIPLYVHARFQYYGIESVHSKYVSKYVAKSLDEWLAMTAHAVHVGVKTEH